MRIVLSKKGYDSSYGGIPSPVFVDEQDKDWNDRMFSFPIPEAPLNSLKTFVDTGTHQCDIEYPFGVAPIVKSPHFGGDETCVHLDPDIRKWLHKELPKGWVPSLGQNGGFVTEIMDTPPFKKNRDDEILFLFFGSFNHYRKTGDQWTEDKKQEPFHAIWGFLHTDRIIELDDNCDVKKKYGWHPHCSPNWPDELDKNNRLFVAENPTWMLNEHCIPSCGVFCYDKMLRLSKKGCSRTKWRLDALPWICANHKDSHMTHQLEKAFDNEDKEYFRAASIGQELVVTIEHVEKCRKIVDWLDKIFLEKKLIDTRWEANNKA